MKMTEALKQKNENWLSMGHLTLTEEWIEVGWGDVDLRERRVKLLSCVWCIKWIKKSKIFLKKEIKENTVQKLDGINKSFKEKASSKKERNCSRLES